MKRILCIILTLVLAASLLCVPTLAAQETASMKGYWNTGFELLMRFNAYSKEQNLSSGGRNRVDIYSVEKGTEVSWITQMMGAVTEGCAVSLTQVRYDYIWGVYEEVPNSRRIFTGSTGTFKLTAEGLWAVGVSDNTSPVAGWDVDMADAGLVVFSVGTGTAASGDNQVRFNGYVTYPDGSMGNVTPITLRFSNVVTYRDDPTTGYCVIDVPMGSTLVLQGKTYNLEHVNYISGLVIESDPVPLEVATTDTTLTYRLVTPGYYRFTAQDSAGNEYNFGRTVLLNVASTVSAPPVPTMYVVQRGDTLASIAKAQLGDSSKWQLIYDANRDKIASPGMIVVGMVLLIPPQTEEETPATPSTPGTGKVVDPGTSAAPSTSPTPPDGYRNYVVQKGDTLAKIAERELGDRSKWTLLYEANKDTMKNKNLLITGQVILIPLNVPLW